MFFQLMEREKFSKTMKQNNHEVQAFLNPENRCSLGLVPDLEALASSKSEFIALGRSE